MQLDGIASHYYSPAAYSHYIALLFFVVNFIIIYALLMARYFQCSAQVEVSTSHVAPKKSKNSHNRLQ
jgi:uncharacterized membrane protein